MYPDQCTKAGAQRAHRGTETDLRNAWRPNDGREKLSPPATIHRHRHHRQRLCRRGDDSNAARVLIPQIKLYNVTQWLRLFYIILFYST